MEPEESSPIRSLQETDFSSGPSDRRGTLLPSQRNPSDEPSSGDRARAHANGTSKGRRSAPATPQPGGSYGSTAPSTTAPPSPSAGRVLAPDLLRGLLMVLMALDHGVVFLRPWDHGTNGPGEMDGAVVRRWNRPLAYGIRTLTHLCGPGFTFLLGMGVVYFGRSRAGALGWSAGRLARHFLVRAVVLTLITVTLGLVFTAGQYWFTNIVLFALAVDYLLAGLLWLLAARTEPWLAGLILRVLPATADDEDAAVRPLLQRRYTEDAVSVRDDGAAREKAARISRHLHNAALLVLSVVTIWWNIWLSPHHGHCPAAGDAKPGLPVGEVRGSSFFAIWFYPVVSEHVISSFPPLAWLSFAILGLLYGRVAVARSSGRDTGTHRSEIATARRLVLADALLGCLFFVFFVLTRVFHFGNLSEGCIRTATSSGPGDDASSSAAGDNPYLSSPAAFFYIIKYPPDVAFWAFTMAGNFLLLAAFRLVPSKAASRWFVRPLLAFGTSALFFYVVHMLMLALLAGVLVPLLGHDVGFDDPETGEPVVGVDQLWAYFGAVGVVLAILYPICRWYGAFKRTKGPDSLWRFF